MTDGLLASTRAVIERIAGPGRTPEPCGPDTPLGDGSWLDSVELLEVMVACETEFGIAFDDAGDLSAGALNTLGTLTEAIRAKRAAARHTP